jgi:hypothetical protein
MKIKNFFVTLRQISLIVHKVRLMTFDSSAANFNYFHTFQKQEIISL